MCLVCNPSAAQLIRMGANRRYFLAGAFKLGGASLFGSLSATAGEHRSSSGPADLIFHNGAIRTMAARAPVAQALAVRNARIAAVGSKKAVEALRGPSTQVIDLEGKALLPGFIDPHMHSALSVLDDWLDVTPFTTRTIADALSKIKGLAAAKAPGEWVQAQGIDPSLMPGDAITREALDAAAPANPVFLLESNGHIAYANTRAFESAGVGRDTQDPPQGRYGRSASGELSGRIEEGPAMKPLMAVMPFPDARQAAQDIRRLFDRACAVGCTSLHDAGIGTGGVSDLDVLDGVMAADPPVRYSGFLTSDLMDDWVARGLKPGQGSDRFRLTGIKFWSDGSNQARTGYQREPYLHSKSRGALNYTLEQLTAGAQRAHDLGWQIGIHANGDAAIDVTLSVYKSILARTPRKDHRHRIEHCSMLHADQMSQMKQMGVSPSFLIGHVHYWGKAFRDDIFGPQRSRLYDPCASALKSGLRISLHSDYNVTSIEPLRYIDHAVNRVMRDGGQVLNPAERSSDEQGLRAVTIDAAWQCRVDDIVGSLEPGKYADLVVLDRDPLAVDPAEIGKLKVLETWLEGTRRHQA